MFRNVAIMQQSVSIGRGGRSDTGKEETACVVSEMEPIRRGLAIVIALIFHQILPTRQAITDFATILRLS